MAEGAENRSGRDPRRQKRPSRWELMREGPRRGGLIQGNRSKDVRAEGVRAEMADGEGAEPRMSIQGCRHKWMRAEIANDHF